MKYTLSCQIVILSLLQSLPCNATAATADPAKPRLVVLVVVDQMRGDYLPRWSKHFGEDGFNRLLREGADFCNAYFSYGSTATAPGHASIITGRIPRQHGIVANDMFLAEGEIKPQQSIDDPNIKIIGIPDADKKMGMSPWRLIGAALGDEMKLADARSRVFSVGLKDRTAILLGGRKPDAAFWWDSSTGNCVSSIWYMEKLPPYMEDFNQSRWCDEQFKGKTWAKMLPDEAYAACHPTDTEWLLSDYGIGPQFPHALPDVGDKPDKKFYKAITATPFGNDIVVEMAERVLKSEKLGRGDAADLFCIGFSANDYVGHIFGPESPEMLDMTVQTDRHIAKLLKLLDQEVGKDKYVLALTADHGVKSVWNVAHAQRLGGGRIDLEATVKSLEDVLQNKFGPPPGKRYIAGIELPWIYLDPSARRSPRLGEIVGFCADQIRQMDGVAEVFTADEMAGHAPHTDDYLRFLAWRSYHPQRSGQFYLQLAPYWYETGDNTTGHSTSYTHDRHVPILLTGPGITPGRYYTAADPLDISVTLAAILGIEKPADALGRILTEALQ